MCPIPKKENVMVCDKYRAVTLLCTTYKILEYILYVKSVPYAEAITGEYQGAFEEEDQILIRFLLRKNN
jgi:hypothetical protein